MRLMAANFFCKGSVCHAASRHAACMHAPFRHLHIVSARHMQSRYFNELTQSTGPMHLHSDYEFIRFRYIYFILYFRYWPYRRGGTLPAAAGAAYRATPQKHADAGELSDKPIDATMYHKLRIQFIPQSVSVVNFYAAMHVSPRRDVRRSTRTPRHGGQPKTSRSLAFWASSNLLGKRMENLMKSCPRIEGLSN